MLMIISSITPGLSSDLTSRAKIFKVLERKEEVLTIMQKNFQPH